MTIIDELPSIAEDEAIQPEVSRRLVIMLERCDEHINNLGFRFGIRRELAVRVERCEKLIRRLKRRGEIEFYIDSLEREKCPHCHKSFLDKYTLQYHIRGIHMGEFKCKFCERLFPSNAKLRLHESRTINGKCKKPGDERRRMSLSFQCDLCLRKFTTKRSLSEHIRGIHLGKYKCENCQHLFTTNATLAKHIRRNFCVARMRKKILKLSQGMQCDLCSKSFSSKKNVKNHIEGIHLGLLTCGDCKSVFGNKQVFINHLLKTSRCIVRSGKIPKECIIDKFDTSDTSTGKKVKIAFTFCIFLKFSVQFAVTFYLIDSVLIELLYHLFSS